MKKIISLAEKLLKLPHHKIAEIKHDLYYDLNYDGVYVIYHKSRIIKIGKTSGKENKKEHRLADRIYGHREKNGRLRQTMGFSIKEIDDCTFKTLKMSDPLIRGRVEYYLISKHCPIVNHAELKR